MSEPAPTALCTTHHPSVPPVRCPACRGELVSPPRRRAPCPLCGEVLWVRSRQTLFPGALLTRPQLRAWETYSASAHLLRDPLVPLQDALRRSADSTEQLDDIIELWCRACVAAASAYPRVWLERLARHRWQAGREWVSVLVEARELELFAYRRQARAHAERMVAIVPGQPGNLCAACSALRGTTLPLRRLIGRGPLPVVGCTCLTGSVPGFCDCWYALQDEPPTPVDPWRWWR